MRFEWDEEKARRNLAKHGVPFELNASSRIRFICWFPTGSTTASSDGMQSAW